jgi:glutamyl-tRNA synthetase
MENKLALGLTYNTHPFSGRFAPMIRTRFAPSPTGFLHIGGARTALFCWAFARKHGGKFILRVEDTDRERSTEASVRAILDAMDWLGLDYDEGPFYQMERLERYRAAAKQLTDNGHAFACYCSREELEATREAQRARGEKPRYSGRCREGRVPVAGIQPVIRFKNPATGPVEWDDLIKGPLSVDNSELDDLVIMRGDGIPTYNFGVVVDDTDMAISHVIRGDDHVNNTPRQINIYRALGASLPAFGHMPMILGPDGERLSKRHGAVSVMQYFEDGYLPDALVNYLARLGWSHGDEEIFSRQQLVDWFDFKHVSRSPARFDPEKLSWINQHYLKQTPIEALVSAVERILQQRGIDVAHGPALAEVLPLFRDRSERLQILADEAMLFYEKLEASPELLAKHLTPRVRPALVSILGKLSDVESLPAWSTDAVSAMIKATLLEHGLKMPELAVPVRVCLFGREKTPDLVQVMHTLGKEHVAQRLRRYLA